MMPGTLVSGNSQIATPFQFPFIVLHGRGAFFNFNLVTFFNSNPHRQLHPSSPTSTHIAFNFNPRRLSISKAGRFSISSPSP
jgi:hypothetical protein